MYPENILPVFAAMNGQSLNHAENIEIIHRKNKGNAEIYVFYKTVAIKISQAGLFSIFYLCFAFLF
jgi:hypothetical protein